MQLIYGLRITGVSIEEKLLTQFDSFIESKGYTNRSEAISVLIKKCLAEEEWRQDGGESFGTIITLVYNHYLRETADRLTNLRTSIMKDYLGFTRAFGCS